MGDGPDLHANRTLCFCVLAGVNSHAINWSTAIPGTGAVFELKSCHVELLVMGDSADPIAALSG